MDARRFDVGSSTSPSHRSERKEYLAENYYLVDTTAVPLVAAVRATAACLARWADRYSARVLVPSNVADREGALPADLAEREALLNEVVDWLERTAERPDLACLSLFEGESWLWDAHDGFPGELMLTTAQFAELLRCWEARRLPIDLYYPAEEQRVEVEPIVRFGGVVRAHRRYSPLQWAHRDLTLVEALHVPTEDERVERFAQACERFVQDLLLRIAELSELGRVENPNEIRELRRLIDPVLGAGRRARRLSPQQPGEPAT